MPGAVGMSVVTPPIQTIAADGATRPALDYEAWLQEGKMMVRVWWALTFNITALVVIHLLHAHMDLIICLCLILGPPIGIWHLSQALVFAYQRSQRWPWFFACSVLAFWNTVTAIFFYGYPFS